jgi:hypothetical protein
MLWGARPISSGRHPIDCTGPARSLFGGTATEFTLPRVSRAIFRSPKKLIVHPMLCPFSKNVVIRDTLGAKLSQCKLGALAQGIAVGPDGLHRSRMLEERNQQREIEPR